MNISSDGLLFIRNNCVKSLDLLVDEKSSVKELEVATRMLNIIHQLDMIDVEFLKYFDILNGANQWGIDFIGKIDSESHRTPSTLTLI